MNSVSQRHTVSIDSDSDGRIGICLHDGGAIIYARAFSFFDSPKMHFAQEVGIECNRAQLRAFLKSAYRLLDEEKAKGSAT